MQSKNKIPFFTSQIMIQKDEKIRKYSVGQAKGKHTFIHWWWEVKCYNANKRRYNNISKYLPLSYDQLISLSRIYLEYISA